MYPKVKVPNHSRDEEEEEAVYYKQRDSCLNSTHLQSPFPENQEDENAKIFVAKVPKIYIPSVITPPICKPAETGKHRRAVRGEVMPNTKTSPILRPRAVISSPDNDAMIGNMNKNKEVKGTKALKTHEQISNRHSQCKPHQAKGHADNERTKNASPRVKISPTVSKGSATKNSTERGGNSRGSKTRVGKRTDP